MPDENKPPADQTGTTEPKGVNIVGRQGKGVVIVDNTSTATVPSVVEVTEGEDEITDEEYISQQTGGPC